MMLNGNVFCLVFKLQRPLVARLHITGFVRRCWAPTATWCTGEEEGEAELCHPIRGFVWLMTSLAQNHTVLPLSSPM